MIDEENDDIAYDWHEDEDYYESWKDPFYGCEPPDPEPPEVCCGDGTGRCCNPTRWDRIRWALRGRLDQLLRRIRKDDPWGSDEGPF